MNSHTVALSVRRLVVVFAALAAFGSSSTS